MYEKCLDAKIAFMMRYAETPEGGKNGPEWGDKIYHATLVFGDYMLQGADVSSESYQKPQGFSLTINTADTAKAERIFNALSQNGTVKMPLQETFWARRFGVLTDAFGIPWMINAEPQL